MIALLAKIAWAVSDLAWTVASYAEKRDAMGFGGPAWTDPILPPPPARLWPTFVVFDEVHRHDAPALIAFLTTAELS